MSVSGKKDTFEKRQKIKWIKIISPLREGWKKHLATEATEKKESFTSECASEVSMLYTDIEKT